MSKKCNCSCPKCGTSKGIGSCTCGCQNCTSTYSGYSPEQPEWKRRFDRDWDSGAFDTSSNGNSFNPTRIKSFISDLLSQQKQELEAYKGKQKREWYMQAYKEAKAELREKTRTIIACDSCNGSGRADSMNGASECQSCGGDGHRLYGREGETIDDILEAIK